MGQIKTVIKKLSEIRPSGFWPGFLIGLVYFSYIFSWIWAVYPLNTLGVTNRFIGLLLILFVFSITVICAAFFWGLFSFFGRWIIHSQTKRYMLPLYLASIFVLVEYLRSWGMGLVWLGSGSFLGPHWTFGNPAYLLSFWPWIVRTSSIWGIYGIDFLLIILVSALVFVIKEKNSRNKKIIFGEILLVLIMLLAANNISFNQQEGAPLTISVIQTKNPTKISYSSKELLDNFDQEDKMLKNAAKYSNIIVFPETANFLQTLSDFLPSDMVQKYFNNLAPQNILIVDSDEILEPSGLKSKVVLVDSKNGITGSYDKKLLTPMGEFLPYILKIPLSIFEYFQKDIPGAPEFTPGHGSNIATYQDNNIKILVCSEIMSPSLAREGTSSFMLDLSSLGIFNGNKRIASELSTAGRFRAVENGKYLILASNYGRSYIINPQGNIIKSTSSSGYQILTGTVVPNKTRTWYNRLGDWPILLLSVVFFSIGLISKKCRIKSR